jgi:hypothetical protein
MSLRIIKKLRELPSHEAARLIGCAPQFISDSNFINLLNQYNLNINRKDSIADRNDMILEEQFQMFASIPGIREQVAKWFSS